MHKARTVVHISDTGIVYLSPNQSINVRPRSFQMSVLSCVGRGDGPIPASKESYQTPIIFIVSEFNSEMLADHSGRAVQGMNCRTLGSWIRIPLKAWISVCAIILYLRCPVWR
jgi:hypothetical protein